MQINGQHIILRSIKISDAKYFLKWTENSDNVRYSLWDFQIPKTLEDYKEYIKISNDIKSGKISFIICDKKSQLPIGEIGLNHIDLINKRARTFTLIGDSKYRAQGLGKEAKQLIIDYAFNTLNLNRLYCSIIEKNEFWISSLINLGFKIEGREREASFREGKYYDKFLLGITRKDWQKVCRQIKNKNKIEKEFFAKITNPRTVYKKAKGFYIFKTIRINTYTYFPFSNNKSLLVRVRSEDDGNLRRISIDLKRKTEEKKSSNRYKRSSKEISLKIDSLENALDIINELNFSLDKILVKTRYQFYIDKILISLDKYSQPDNDWWIEIENSNQKDINKILKTLNAKY